MYDEHLKVHYVSFFYDGLDGCYSTNNNKKKENLFNLCNNLSDLFYFQVLWGENVQHWEVQVSLFDDLSQDSFTYG